MRIRFVHYKLSWMQEKGAVLLQLILHIEAGGDYHTSVKYECASFYIWTWKCQQCIWTKYPPSSIVSLLRCWCLGICLLQQRPLLVDLLMELVSCLFLCFASFSFCQDSAVLPFKTASSSSSDNNQLQESQGRRETIQNTGSSTNLHC